MNPDIYKKSILLIGPSGAGKSTVAEALANKTGMPRFCLDAFANQLQRDHDLMNQFQTSDQFNLFLLRNVLERVKEPGICDFGAGHSIFHEKQSFEQVKKLLLPFENIVLLLPSNDPIESLEILNARTTSKRGAKENLEFLKSPCNKMLATFQIDTKGKNPDKISDEIIAFIKKQSIKNKNK